MERTPSKKPEFIRKRLVALKRKPQMIALAVLAAAFVYYSLNLTQVSNTTAKIYGAGMGLANSKRVADVFDIKSTVPTGTTVLCEFNLPPAAAT